MSCFIPFFSPRGEKGGEKIRSVLSGIGLFSWVSQNDLIEKISHKLCENSNFSQVVRKSERVNGGVK